jgi:hypothetical protein
MKDNQRNRQSCSLYCVYSLPLFKDTKSIMARLSTLQFVAAILCLCFASPLTSAFSPSCARPLILSKGVGANVNVMSKHHRRPSTSASTSALFSQDQAVSSLSSDQDPLIQELAITLRRVNWVSWWSQVVLSVISTVTLVFAKSVLKTGVDRTSVAGGFLFAGSGITLGFLSIIWTWGGSRLSKRLRQNDYSRIKAANMIRRTITIGSVINLIGMFVTLIGAQQIVGLLASKLLTMQGLAPFGMNAAAVSAQTLQPLDILIVQANTNTLLSHFISLVCCLIMTRGVDKLDPPSTEEDPR